MGPNSAIKLGPKYFPNVYRLFHFNTFPGVEWKVKKVTRLISMLLKCVKVVDVVIYPFNIRFTRSFVRSE